MLTRGILAGWYRQTLGWKVFRNKFPQAAREQSMSYERLVKTEECLENRIKILPNQTESSYRTGTVENADNGRRPEEIERSRLESRGECVMSFYPKEEEAFKKISTTDTQAQLYKLKAKTMAMDT